MWDWTGPNGFTSTDQSPVGPNVTIADAGPYVLTVTDTAGCSDADSVTVTVNPLPTVDAGQDKTICFRDCEGLSFSSGSGTLWAWSTGETTQEIIVCPTIISTYTISVTDPFGCVGTDDLTVTVDPCSTQVNAKTLLQGNYAGSGQMNPNLVTIIPDDQPFNRLPWNYTGGENLNSANENSDAPANMVDWILVELRSAEDSSLIVAQRAALLMDDGNIADTNLAASITFDSVPPGNYYLCLHHRNALPVMSANPIPTPNSFLYDFSDPVSNPPFGGVSQALIELEPGIYGMIGGDVNSDGILKYSGPNNDRGLVLQLLVNQTGSTSITTTINGYYDEDISMDGTVKYSGPDNDPSIIIQNLVNLSGSTSITTIFVTPVPVGVKANP